ncbi:MAG: hypothetical protein E6Q97_38365 [Desulfurellales bacterium]|nr:MAG: hypothetical protein E6Q97_38365 [Desulfurellales bacterium]
MPAGQFAPSRIHLDYPEWAPPAVGDTGKPWVWNNSTGKYEQVSGVTFASGVATLSTALVVGAIRPASDSANSINFQNSAGNFNNVEIDTTNQALILKNSQTRMVLGGYAPDKRYFCIWIGNNKSATSSIQDSVFNAIDDGSVERNVFFNAPGATGKLFFRQNNGTFMSIQSNRMQISISSSEIGDASARLNIAADAANKKALVLFAAASQTANVFESQDNNGVVQFGLSATGRILTNQAVTNTNTPTGPTTKALPVYHASGTFQGYIPIYANPW